MRPTITYLLIQIISIGLVFANKPEEKLSYTLHINVQQGRLSKFIEYDKDRQQLIRSSNHPFPSIEIYDIKTGRLRRQIRLNISKIGSFKRVGENHFWINDFETRHFYLIDGAGTALKKVKEPTYSRNTSYISTSASNFCPTILYKSTIYATGMVFFKDLERINQKELRSTGILKKMDFKEGGGFIVRPSALSLKNFYGNMNGYSSTLNKNTLILAPYFCDELILFDLDKQTEKTITLQTKYGRLIKPLSPLNDISSFTNKQRNDYYKKSHTNIGLVYDKYKDIYYRFVRLPYAKPGPMDCSILVLNKNFKVISEKKINSRTHDVANYFVTERGLAILNYAKYNVDDSKLVFDVINLYI